MNNGWLTSRPTAALGAEREHRIYSASELAEDAGVTVRTVRFYEQKGLLTPRKVGATRVYTYRDRARLELILRGKRIGASLDEIAAYLELYDCEGGEVSQLQWLIDNCEDRIADLARQRADIDRLLTDLTDMKNAAQERLENLELPAIQKGAAQ